MDETVNIRTTPIDEASMRRILVFGIEWKVAAALWACGAMMLMLMYVLGGAFSQFGVGLVLGMHALLAWVMRGDADFFRVLWRYYRQAAVYDAWPHVRVRRGVRPDGFSEGSLC